MLPRYRTILFATLCTAYMLVFIQNAAITVLAPDVMEELALSPEAMGRLSSVYLCAYALMQFFSGLISSRLGPRLLMGLQFALAAAGGLLFATSTGLLSALPGRALNGVGMAGVMVSSFVLFGRWFAPSMFSRLCTAFFVAGGLGGFLATTPLALLTQACGWRFACAALACAAAVLSAAIFLVVRNFPPEAEGQKNAAPGHLREDLRALAANRTLWRLVLLFLALASAYFVFHGLWGGVYLQKAHGLSPAQAGNILAMGAVGHIAGAPFVTWLSEGVLHSHRRTLFLAGMLGACSFGALILFGASMPLWGLYAVSLGIGVAANGPNPIAYATARALVGTEGMGATSGIMASGLFMTGALLQNLSGFILEHMQHVSAHEAFAAAFLPMAVLGLAAALLSLGLPETCTRKNEEQKKA